MRQAGRDAPAVRYVYLSALSKYHLTNIPVKYYGKGMARKISPIIREYLASLGKKGGKRRAEKYDQAALSEWAKLGGRPRKPLDEIGEAGRYQRMRRAKQKKQGGK